MYLFDFFKNVFRKANVPIMIYLVLNAVLITLILNVAAYDSVGHSIFWGIVLYLVSLAVGISPIGEAILRFQTGCRKIKDPSVREYIQPIFDEVYQKARAHDPSIPDDVKLYMNDSRDVNAFATGRKTVCMTRGMLNEDPRLIKAALGHEMGHLAHHDTDLILLITVSNFFASFLFLLIRIAAKAVSGFGLVFALLSGHQGDDSGFFAGLFIKLGGWIADLLTVVVMNLWSKIGILLVMKSSRDKEYEADKFSFELGYGVPLCHLLNSFPANEEVGLFRNLMNSHPDKEDRINHLRQLDVNYRIM